jgi:hypothetical protein
LSFATHSQQGATCRHCRDVIGVYEPMVVQLDGKTLLTSRAASDETIPHDAHRYHETCFALVQGGRPPGRA